MSRTLIRSAVRRAQIIATKRIDVAVQNLLIMCTFPDHVWYTTGSATRCVTCNNVNDWDSIIPGHQASTVEICATMVKRDFANQRVFASIEDFNAAMRELPGVEAIWKIVGALQDLLIAALWFNFHAKRNKAAEKMAQAKRHVAAVARMKEHIRRTPLHLQTLKRGSRVFKSSPLRSVVNADETPDDG
ncbi:hypothetical protein NUW58_g7905 [Xylaria curta]|uniref:Uncharacterized protein n=1 Tax=Xylaria curta TaxID=42375 RepID=A0ACC1NF43_9PEZI|nr:hypothetical protein NUW58_g7905 [Xylaria curta]